MTTAKKFIAKVKSCIQTQQKAHKQWLRDLGSGSAPERHAANQRYRRTMSKTKCARTLAH